MDQFPHLPHISALIAEIDLCVSRRDQKPLRALQRALDDAQWSRAVNKSAQDRDRDEEGFYRAQEQRLLKMGPRAKMAFVSFRRTAWRIVKEAMEGKP